MRVPRHVTAIRNHVVYFWKKNHAEVENVMRGSFHLAWNVATAFCLFCTFISIEICNVTWILNDLLCVDTKVSRQQKKQKNKRLKFQFLTKEIIKK